MKSSLLLLCLALIPQKTQAPTTEPPPKGSCDLSGLVALDGYQLVCKHGGVYVDKAKPGICGDAPEKDSALGCYRIVTRHKPEDKHGETGIQIFR